MAGGMFILFRNSKFILQKKLKILLIIEREWYENLLQIINKLLYIFTLRTDLDLLPKITN